MVAGGCLGQHVRGQGHAPDKYQLGMEPAAYVCRAVMAGRQEVSLCLYVCRGVDSSSSGCRQPAKS